MPASEALIMAIAATAELCGKVYTPAAAALLASDLDGFDEPAVLAALTRCRKELDGKPFNVAAVIARIDDGRPGPQEAWALMPFDEAMSVVWSEEMREAWFVAEPLLDGRQNVAARMAFLEAYAKAMTTARDQRLPAKWTPSLGHDQHGRVEALRIAVEKGRIGIEHARTIAPQLEAPTPRALQLLAQVNIRRIEA
jgi:hypothetical protein